MTLCPRGLGHGENRFVPHALMGHYEGDLQSRLNLRFLDSHSTSSQHSTGKRSGASPRQSEAATPAVSHRTTERPEEKGTPPRASRRSFDNRRPRVGYVI